LPIDVVGLSNGMSAIAAGSGHTCALTTAGGVKCWGANGGFVNNAGQLGDGTGLGRLTPADVVGLSSGVNTITAGFSHTCALMTTGGVKCWGSNFSGQLGDGSTVTTRLTPVTVSGF
jgi:alpha-tubulin suppressor-like RCC1 family protein